MVILILDEPTMSEVETKYLFSGGDKAELVIGENLESNPEAVVTWTTPQGVTFKESNGRYTISSGPEKVQLSISGVSERDNGTWTVTVEVLSTEIFKNCSNQNSLSKKMEFFMQLIVVGKSSGHNYICLTINADILLIVPPSEPRNLYVDEIDTSKVLVRWKEPLVHGSPFGAGYMVCYNSSCDTMESLDILVTVYVLGLDQGKLYNISVYAISKSDNTTVKSPPATRMFTIGKSFYSLLYTTVWENVEHADNHSLH